MRKVQVARDGDYSDGGGLILRVKNGSAVWVLRFTAPSGKRREMGLGRVDRNNAQAVGNSITHARQQAQDARAKPQQSIDPIDARLSERQAAKEAARNATLTVASDRFNYDYPDHELTELSTSIKHLARRVDRVQVVFNNNYCDQGQRNATTLIEMLK